jgi:hypothetical protein
VLRLQGRVGSHQVFLLGQQTKVFLGGQAQLEILELGLVALVAFGFLRLQLQRAKPGFDLADDIGHAQQVLAGGLHATLGHLLLGLVLGDARRFVDERTAIFRPGRNDEADAPLFNDGVGLGTDPGAKKELDDVAQAAGDAAQQVLALAAAVEAAGNHHIRRSSHAPGHAPGRHIAGHRGRIKGDGDFRQPAGPRDSEPLKMTSSMARPRRCLADCSPMTHRIASTMFDLPQPFGPTTPVMGSSNVSTVRSTKDLNPQISSRFIRIEHHPDGVTLRDHTSHFVTSDWYHLAPRSVKPLSPHALIL